jgi:hypothetical protein
MARYQSESSLNSLQNNQTHLDVGQFPQKDQSPTRHESGQIQLQCSAKAEKMHSLIGGEAFNFQGPGDVDAFGGPNRMIWWAGQTRKFRRTGFLCVGNY